jgi:hypothetical protein
MALVLNFGRMPLTELRAIEHAGRVAAECLAAWRAEHRRVIDEFVSGPAPQDEFTHYPSDDVRNAITGAQYFYHCHRGAQEHGHFHLFLRRAGMPRGVRARRWPRSVTWPSGRSAMAHLVAISMAGDGTPQALFCTNRWVTDETWYPAHAVVQMLDRFRPSGGVSSTRADQWIEAMVVLFRPQIAFLLQHRDRVIGAWRRAHKGADVLEDANLEVTGMLVINIDAQRRAVAAALARRSRRPSHQTASEVAAAAG